MTQSIFKNTQYFILDMDGTFYLGDRLIEGAPSFIEKLLESGRDYLFFTNNSSNDVETCLNKLCKMGFKASEDKIIISSHITIDYIQKNYDGASVYLLGNEKLTAHFKSAGINLTQDKPDIVVLGFDTSLNYKKMWDAVRFLEGGATYIATHPDVNCPTPDGYMPDVGSMIALFETSTGRRPLIMGKPATATVDYLTSYLACSRKDLAFVGDRLSTDILIGQDHGIPNALVLSGVTGKAELEASDIKPDITVDRLADLAPYL